MAGVDGLLERAAALASRSDCLQPFPGDGDPRTPLVVRLRRLAQECPDDVACVWMDETGNETAHITYGDLWLRSGVIAEHLVSPEVGLRPGGGAIIVFPLGLEFLPALIGCFRAGVVAHSVYPPNPAKLTADLPKLASFAEASGAAVALTTLAFKRFVALSRVAGHVWPSTIQAWVATDSVGGLSPLQPPRVPTPLFTSWDWNLPQPQWVGRRRLIAPSCMLRPSPPPPLSVPADSALALDPTTVALVQYTSGSTGTPRGVMVTHRALSYAVAMSGRAGDADAPGAAKLIWVPQYHDLGLIGAFLTCPCFRMPLYAMSPADFLKNPLLWVDLMSLLRITHTSGPNFGWGLAIKRAEARGTPVDLSHLRVAVIGAEPILATVQQGMQDTLRIPLQSINAGFCCAEMVLVITARDHGFDAETGVAACGLLAWAEEAGSLAIIVDPDTRMEQEDGLQGEIWAQSPSIGAGYWGLPQETQERFQCVVASPHRPGHWYNTKDLGFIKNGHLFVLGRVADLIIVNGRNVFPSDVEHTVNVAADAHLRPGSTVALQTKPDAITILCELRNADVVPTPAALLELAQAVERLHEVHVQAIACFPKSALPKTTSGKVRRRETRRQWLEGGLSRPLCIVESDADTSSDPNMTWDAFLLSYGATDHSRSLAENGVDSLRLARLVAQAEERFGIVIDVRAASSVPISQLHTYSCATPGLSAALPSQPEASAFIGTPIPAGCVRGLMQVTGVVFVLLVLSACAIPAGFVYQSIPEWVAPGHEEPWLRMFPGTPGLLTIIVPLVWMATFTLMVIVLKWTLIGMYRPRCLSMWSWPFWRWWVVDRLMDVWGLLVGVHLLDTPYLTAVYKLLGARVAWTCRMQTFIREHDLFAAGPCTIVAGLVNCRLMSQSGLWMDRVSVATREKLPTQAVIYPGQTTVSVTERIRDWEPAWLQRLLSPFAVIAAFGVGVYCCAAVMHALGISSTSLQLFICFPGAALVVVAEAVVLTRLQVLPVLVDRIATAAGNSLRPWLDFSVVVTWILRAFGASLGPGVSVSKLSVVAASDACRVSAGMGTMLSRCTVSPAAGRVRFGAQVTVGIGSVIHAGSELQDGCATFPFSVLPPDTTVPPHKLFMNGHSRITTNAVAQRLSHHGWWGYAWWELLSFTLRALTVWVPLLLAEEAVRYVMDHLVAGLNQADVPTWLAVWISSFVFAVLGGTAVMLLMLLGQWTLVPTLAAGAEPVHMDSYSLRALCYVSSLALTEIVTVWVRPFISGSMLHNALLKLCGARLPGWTDTVLMDAFVMDPRLTCIEPGVVCDRFANMNGHSMSAGVLMLGRVCIGADCILHPASFVRAGEHLRPGTVLAAGSCFFGPRSSYQGAHTEGGGRVMFAGAPAVRCLQQII